MGLLTYFDSLEAAVLKLRTEHLPTQVSLRQAVLQRYASDTAVAPGETMPLESVLDYLRRIDDFTQPPLAAVRSLAEAENDSHRPSAPHSALLEWVTEAFGLWQKNYPLARELNTRLRQLLPVAAAMAIVEPQFLVPGALPLHLMLDDIQASAIGWQPRLGRAGQTLEDQIAAAVNDTRAWFDDQDTDLKTVWEAFKLGAERDHARAARMKQRVVDVELGRIKTAAARAEAARMINDGLNRYDLPQDIGTFVKGAWYDSAQLVLLKFGSDSEQWGELQATTETLLDSMQESGPQGENRRQFLFEMVTKLPKELKRWLLSLQHDTEAINEAMTRIELAHLRLLRQQDTQLMKIEPLPIAADQPPAHRLGERSGGATTYPGQWFRIERREDVMRVQLAFKLEHERQLLFTNQAGVKSLLIDDSEFAQLVAAGRAQPLSSGYSFSMSLTEAAGIATLADLEMLTAANSLEAQREAQAATEELASRERELLQREQERDAQHQQLPGESAGVDTAAESSQTPPGNELEQDAGAENAELELQLPIGTWLGFHDGSTPMMARLAVYDRDENTYIFVNRAGIKLRQLNRAELLSLIDQDLIDVLEARATFKDAIKQVKEAGPGESG